MSLKAPLHIFKFSRIPSPGPRDRLAEEAGPSEDLHALTGSSVDSLRWEAGRLLRSSGSWYFNAADQTGPVLPVTRQTGRI